MRPARHLASPKPRRIELPGCENVFILAPGLMSGSQPQGETAFRALARYGVKTVISVDGARPQLEFARKHKIRYVHLPIGYASIPRVKVLQLARAIRDLPGPIYVHCHHGQHRGPAAAATGLVAVRGWSQRQAVSFMKQAGASEKYSGLYDSVRSLLPPTSEAIDEIALQFPETARLPRFVSIMADIGIHLDHLKEVRAAGWAALASQPDIDPPHEALMLREAFVEIQRIGAGASRSVDFRRRSASAEIAAADLEFSIRSNSVNPEPAYRRLVKSCQSCHSRYRG